MKRFLTVFTVFFVATFLCTGGFASPNADNAAPGKQVPSAKAEAKADPVLSGKVVETMNSGGYTYVCLEKRGKKIWVAVPEMKVTVGQKIGFQPGMEMINFTSKSLNRTFERIIFSGGPLVTSEATSKKAAPAAMQGSGKAASTAPAGKISVEKAAGPDAYTVSEIFTQKASLNNKSVVLRGKVVKVSSGIMDKNWMHLQDGTGDAEKGNHDLVVTSQDSATVGDVVTVKGTIYMNKDFGAGYKYEVIMEEASIQR
jgi:hypothetical protein